MPSNERQPFVGLALSGGGARAMAFHLGCMRALHDRRILDKVKVISTVSGGSIIGACWSYRGESFEDFDRHVVSILRRGLQRDILREAFLSWEGPKILATLIVTGTLSVLIATICSLLSWARRWARIPTGPIETFLARVGAKLPIWGSLTTAFEAALERRLFGKLAVDQVRRPGLTSIVNACDLKTGTAFRFGSARSGGWRYGTVVGSSPTVAKAVAASAAFPILLPPLVETFEFEKNGRRMHESVSLTDGGVYDNLGVAVLEPGRADDAIFRHPVTHLISLNAGAGQYVGSEDRHFWWGSRVKQSFGAVHRKSQDAVYQRLHKYAETGELSAFGMVYLGQQDEKLPWAPDDLVRRDQVRGYPTDFAPMSVENLALLTKRGEQLTHVIVDRYLPDLIG
jgi:NTE family protein